MPLKSPISTRDNPDKEMENVSLFKNFNMFRFKFRGLEGARVNAFCLFAIITEWVWTTPRDFRKQIWGASTAITRMIMLNLRKGVEMAPTKYYCHFNKWMIPLWRESRCSCRCYRKDPMHSIICWHGSDYIFLLLVPAFFQQMRTLFLLLRNSTWSPSTWYLNLFQQAVPFQYL